MADAYDRLVATGAIASLKRDIVMEASADTYYLAHIRRWFAEKAGADAAHVATACTVRLVGELRANDLCSLAIWGKEKGSFDAVEKTAEELLAHIDKYARSILSLSISFSLQQSVAVSGQRGTKRLWASYETAPANLTVNRTRRHMASRSRPSTRRAGYLQR